MHGAPIQRSRPTIGWVHVQARVGFVLAGAPGGGVNVLRDTARNYALLSARQARISASSDLILNLFDMQGPPEGHAAPEDYC